MRKRRKGKVRINISFKIIALFTAMIFIGAALIGTTFQSGSEKTLVKEIEDRMVAFGDEIERLYVSGQITEESLPYLLVGSFFHAKIFDTKEELAQGEYVQTFFSKEELAALEDNKRIVTGFKEQSVKVARLAAEVVVLEREGQEQYLFICPNVGMSIFQFRGAAIKAILLVAGIAILMICGGTQFIVKPVKRLAAASRRIAKGDFEVEVHYRGNDELGDLVKDFNKMAKELNNIEILRSDFISDISHEFRTPLTSIEGYTKLLEGCRDEEERQQYIDIIVAETARLSRLSQSILLINRLENQNIDIKLAPFALDEQIRQVILLCEHSWSEKNIELNIDLAEVTYVGNEELLHQVWMNLLDNAVKFSPESGKITILLFYEEDKVIFKIQNKSDPISQETKQRIFEKFYKGDKSRTTAGNGLGLSIVKRVLELHGGNVSAENEKPGMITFTVIL